MFWIVLGMTLTVVLAAFVVGIVALPARRAGRPVLTTRGEKLFRVGHAPPAPRAATAKDGERAPERGGRIRRS